MIKVLLSIIFVITVLDMVHAIDTPAYLDGILFGALVATLLTMFATRRKDRS